MSNRLTIQELAGSLAESTGKSNDSIEQFLNEFVAVVRDRIFVDRLVQIKNIGNFKIIQVEKRESVDVNTKERIVIPEHYKLSFVPDKDMKDIVNKPFDFLDTIEIANGVDIPSAEPDEEEIATEDDNPEEEIATGTKEENREEKVPLQIISPPEEEPVAEICPPEEISIKTKQPIKNKIMANDSGNRMDPNESRLNNNHTVVVLLLALVVILIISLVSVLLFNKDAIFGGEKNGNTLVEGITPGPETPGGFALPPDDNTSLEDEWGGEDDDIFGSAEETPDVTPPSPPEPQQRPNRSTISSRKTVRVQSGDRLNLFALEYYGNKVFWVYIYQYNQSKLGNPDNIPVGIELTIPAANEYQIDPNNPASVKRASVLQSQILSQYAASSKASSWNGGNSSYQGQGNYNYSNQPYTYPPYSQDTYSSGSYGTSNDAGQYGNYPPYDNTNTYNDPYNTSGNNRGYEYGSSLYDNTLNNNNNTVYPSYNSNPQYNNSQNNINPYR
ncbi:MAG: HU family DNA-binding protein [Tannerellaceae bacterium]|jgi:nucleoid DNA-binding protein/nucleoid-associated protein YgaU|nr:HU family DNA-binding protein [Tannerellaceae bacterium]